MALDLGPKLEEALRDTTNDVWSATEIDDILASALEQANRVRPRVVSDTIALDPDTDNYVLTNVWEVFRVDLLDGNGKFIMPMPQGTWEIWGDNISEGQTLYINPKYTGSGYSLRVHGYGPYTYSGTTNPPTIVQAAILARSRAEALRRVATERSRFEQYATVNPRGDTSMAELLQQVNESDNEANRLFSEIRLIKKPTSARV
jgi:hypothetical protein